jgi:hypothetical protein
MPEHLQKILYTAEAVVDGGQEAMPVPWTGALSWICRSRRRWAAAGSLAPTPSSCSPSDTRPASSQRCRGRGRPQAGRARVTDHLPGRGRPDRARRLRADRGGTPQNQVPQHRHHLAVPAGQQPDAGPPRLQVRGDGDHVDHPTTDITVTSAPPGRSVSG